MKNLLIFLIALIVLLLYFGKKKTVVDTPDTKELTLENMTLDDIINDTSGGAGAGTGRKMSFREQVEKDLLDNYAQNGVWGYTGTDPDTGETLTVQGHPPAPPDTSWDTPGEVYTFGG